MTATHAQNFTDDQQSYLANAERIAKVAVNRKEPLFRFLRFSSEPEKASVRAALVDRHFRFGRPRDFNDPFDCQPHLRIRGWFRWSRRRRFKHESLKRVREQFPGDSEKEERAMAELDNNSDNSLVEQSESRVRKSLLDSQQMLCLAGNRVAIQMWAYYADRQRGICLHLRPKVWPVAAAMRVSYTNHYPTVSLPIPREDNRELIRQFALRKSKAWRHESEYRILVQDEDLQRFGLEWVSENTAVFPAGTVAGITVGYLMDEAEVRVVKSYAAAATPDLPVYRAIARPNRFKLNFERIE